MKYEPELFEPDPSMSQPTNVSSYLTHAETVALKANKVPSAGWLIAAWVLGIIGVLAFFQGGFLYLPVAWFCYWYYDHGNAVYKKAISPLTYTPRTQA